ncbi:MAG TPA: GNAT family N-acetyltransferase [Beijerinckiaceae bacterium]|nr:GNAT family N-acetyltransferase [Beijerinckiaceae bacterium]
MTATLAASLDGITDIPAGHVATIKTYLAMPERPTDTGSTPLDRPLLERLRGAQHARYRSIFATLGRRWLWWSRLQLSAGDLAAVLDDPSVEAYAVVADGADAGLMEFDFREPGRADLAFLGLFEGHTGQGTGTALMAIALSALWRAGVSTVTVNTCTFDHPAALAFYRRSGFSVVKQAVEIVPDPRLAGLLPRDAAPHVPLLPRT